ncbi:MAG: type II toxin-antitoxin system PemK/MazF family toxin, partial [Prolixibacteraceae bacterium]|nr:type II toxin-antitoxin system PemK/MazF family toxin [Prolixibacteraceae bacterium]
CKLRPAVVISDDTVHKTGDVMIVQITSKHKPDNLSIVLSSDDVSEPLEKDFPFSAPNPRNAPKRGRGS